LDNTAISQKDYAITIVDSILHLPNFELSIDRTNWERGEQDINYFVASVIWNNTAIPIYWELLDNKGGSSSDIQRIRLIQWVIDVFGAHKISNLYADREFPSEQFINFLLADNRSCDSLISLDMQSSLKFNSMLNENSEHDESIITVGEPNLSFINIKQRLTIIVDEDQLYLVEKLQNQEYKIYTLRNNHMHAELRRLQYQQFKFDTTKLSEYFTGYISRPAINFVQRAKSSTMVSYGKKTLKLSLLFKKLTQKHNTKIASHICRAFNHRVYISAHLNEHNEFVFLVSNQPHKNPFIIYKRRWFIETMFNKFKTGGFNLESTHLRNPIRLQNLFQLVALAFTCCCKLGHAVNEKITPIKIKTFGSKLDKAKQQQRPQFSLFKLGFELLKNFFNNHLFNKASMAKLLYKILDSDATKLKLNKRSAAFKILGSIN